jgi:signal peptidase II
MEASRSRRVVHGLLALLLGSGLLGCDHATKEAASALANRPAQALIAGVLELRYTENHDTAFSLLRGVEVPHKATVLLVLSVMATLLVVGLWVRRAARATAWEHAGLAMMVAGAIGNVADRMTRGYVIDFIHLERWPVFNVADIAVVAGIFALAIAALRARHARTTSPTPPA